MKLAQDLDKIQSEALPDFEFTGGKGDLGSVVSSLINYLFPIAGILVLLYLLLGGFQMMLSRGDPKAMQSAKGRVTNALVGFVVVFVAYWIVQLVASLLGLENINLIFSPNP